MKKKYVMLLFILSGIPFAYQLQAQDTLTVNFTSMTPHLGQDLSLFLRDTVTGEIADSQKISPIDTANFTVKFDSIVPGNSYYLDFYADLNQNGMYDVPPTDHAWRIVLKDVLGDTTINFVHNTHFTDITWVTQDNNNQLTLKLTSMTPHLGQDLNFYLRNPVSAEILDSIKLTAIDTSNFSVVFDSLMTGSNYFIDFYADLNGNGLYDAPPVDHAWRIELNDVQGDTTITFVHNTHFTDIFAEDTTAATTYKLSIHFMDMAPHLDQDLLLYLRDPASGDFIDSVMVTPVDTADFTVVFDSVAINTDYNLDFYADLNGNGVYDVPPQDHAWRIPLTGIDSDTTIVFAHNTNFTDIGLGVPTGIDPVDENRGFSVFPNPAQHELTVNLSKPGTGISIYNAAGALVMRRILTPADRLVKLNISTLNPGLYILRLNSDSGSSQQKFMKE